MSLRKNQGSWKGANSRMYGRERTWYDESEVFATRQEIEEFVIQKRARQLMNDLMDYSKRYHIPLENLKQKLIQ